METGLTTEVNGQRKREIFKTCNKPFTQLTAPAAEWCNLAHSEEH